MGRRKNNPSLVEELISGRWTMNQDEFDKKYNSLSSDDKYEVGRAIDRMEKEFMSDDFDSMFDDDDEDDDYD